MAALGTTRGRLWPQGGSGVWSVPLLHLRALGMRAEVALGLFSVGGNIGKVLSIVHDHDRVSKIYYY